MILRKTKLIVYLAVTFSFLASLSVFLYLKGISTRSPVSSENYRQVIVASKDLDAGKRLTDKDIKVVSWPERLIPKGSFERPEDVIGKVSERDFLTGEPLLAPHLEKKGTLDGVAALTPPGMRAMSVSIGSNEMIDQFLRPNSRVDVLATIKSDKKGGGYISKSILQNIKVLSVSDNKGGALGPGKQSGVTLLVTPGEAERLALAENQGVLYLVLRNIADQDPLTTSGATVSSLINGERKDVAVGKKGSKTGGKGPATSVAKTTRHIRRQPKVRIEVIRGMEREEMVFENP
jgi:pilus assembly protein CpaB